MLTVRTYLKESPGKGIGLFAKEPIKEGQVVWAFHPLLDLLIDAKDVPLEAKDFFDTYAVEYEKGKLGLNVDNARFINHAKDANTRSLGMLRPNVAVRDIAADEEITIDYETIDINKLDF